MQTRAETLSVVRRQGSSSRGLWTESKKLNIYLRIFARLRLSKTNICFIYNNIHIINLFAFAPYKINEIDMLPLLFYRWNCRIPTSTSISMVDFDFHIVWICRKAQHFKLFSLHVTVMYSKFCLCIRGTICVCINFQRPDRTTCSNLNVYLLFM